MKFLAIATAMARHFALSFRSASHAHHGVRKFDWYNYPLETLIHYIDWTPFFIIWDLAGKYPAILQDEVVGEAATSLFNDAKKMLADLINNQHIQARAVISFWPAAQINHDDIQILTDETQSHEIITVHHLRQQVQRPQGKPNYSLADFIAPAQSGIKDYIGGFTVTAGIGADELAKSYEQLGDDYNSIMVKALADRLAEAFAEHMHERVRTKFWGYSHDEQLSNEQLIKEQYSGIRPAPGYPACPDHSEKETLFNLLHTEANTRVSLTEHFAMLPAASVSGWYFSHPHAKYFGLGKIDQTQLDSYAKRKNITIAEARRWLQPNLI